jgi:lipopolysaccharide heptosyltransferase II
MIEARRHEEWAREWAGCERLLCVRLDSIGDLLMTTPAIRALKRARQGRRITLLTSPVAAAAAALVPEIDEVLVYSAPWMKATRACANAASDRAMIERMQTESFDGAVIFTVYSQSPLPAALFLYLAGIPRRLARCRENPYLLLTHWLPEHEPEQGVRHEVERQLDLAGAIGGHCEEKRLSLAVPARAREAVRATLARAGIGPDDAWVLIHPGASAASRRYPPHAFAEVARRLATDAGLRIVLAGGAGEAELVELIRRRVGVPAVALAGTLTFAELAALVSLAPLLICNNSGPAHVAAAVQTPVVDIYALTNPQHTPWAVPSRVLSYDVPCKYCYRSVCPEGHNDCLRRVEPREVTEAAVSLLHETAAPAGARL